MSGGPALGPLTWAFYSPRRLASVTGGGLLALVLGITAVSHALSPSGGDAAAPVAVASPVPVVAGAATPGPAVAAPPDGHAVHGPVPVDDAAAKVATAFVRAWLKGPEAGSPAAWHAAMRPHVTTELLGGLKRADPARVPAGRVAGGAPEVRTVGDYMHELTVRLNNGRAVHLTLAYDGVVWRVADVDAPVT